MGWVTPLDLPRRFDRHLDHAALLQVSSVKVRIIRRSWASAALAIGE
jgi:hypothetical protein